MRRWFLALAAGAVLISVGTTEETKPAPAKPVSDDSELGKAKKAFDDEVAKRTEEIKKARTADEAQELQKDLREFKIIELDGLLDTAAKEPSTELAFDIFSELAFGGFDEQKSKLARLMIEKHHLEQPYVKKLVQPIIAKGDNRADSMLTIIATKNPDKDCRGQATYGMGLYHKAKVRQAGGEAKVEEMKKAKEWFGKTIEKYADIKLGEKTLGKLAAGELKALELVGQLEIGKAVPELEGEDLDGKAMKLSDHKGKVVMISFWATWCPPCMRLVPHEKALVEKLKDKPFALVGINGDPELTDEVKEIIKDTKITWRSFKDAQKDCPPFSQTWEIEGWPTICLIDHKGIIKQKWTGSPGEDKMDKAIDELVKAAEAK